MFQQNKQKKPQGSQKPTTGLFGNKADDKPFGSNTGSMFDPKNNLFGSLEKTQTTSLFASATPNLFGTGGLFGQSSTQGQNEKSTNQPSIFANITQKQQEKPTLLFGSTKQANKQSKSSSLFGQKKDTLASTENISKQPQKKPQEPKTSSIFGTSLGGGTGGLFGSMNKSQNKQPNKSLFGQGNISGLFGAASPSEQKKPQVDKQKQPANSLFSGSSGGSGNFGGFGVLFGKKEQNAQDKKEPEKVQPPVKVTGGLFGQSKPQQKTKTNQTSFLGFSTNPQQKKPQKKPQEKSQEKPNIFSNTQTLQKKPEQKPSLFSLNKQTIKPAQNLFFSKPSQGLFGTKRTQQQIAPKPSLQKVNSFGIPQNLDRTKTFNVNKQQQQPINSDLEKQIQIPILDKKPQFEKQKNQKSKEVQQKRPALQEKKQEQTKSKEPTQTSTNLSGLGQRRQRIPDRSHQDRNQQPPKPRQSGMMSQTTQKKQVALLDIVRISMTQSSESNWKIIYKQYKGGLLQFIVDLFRIKQPDSDQSTSTNIKFHDDPLLNNFFKDFLYFYCKIMSHPRQSLKTFLKIFHEMIVQMKLEKILIKDGKGNQQYINNKLYYQKSGVSTLVQQSEQLQSFVNRFTDYVEYTRKLAIKILHSFPKILIRNNFEVLLTYPMKRCLTPIACEPDYFSSKKQLFNKNNLDLLQCLKNIANNFGREYNITIHRLADVLKLLDILKGKQFIEPIQKTILMLCPINGESWTVVDVARVLQNSKSMQLLPFRFIQQFKNTRIDPTFLPQSRDLFYYVKGPQWYEWLQNYVRGSEKYLQAGQQTYIINCLKTFDKRVSSRLLEKSSNLFKFIMTLKQQGQNTLFFEGIATLVYDEESVRKIQQMMFRNFDEITYYLNPMIVQVIRFPKSLFKNQEIPSNLAKIKFLLQIACHATSRLHKYGQSLFRYSGSGLQQQTGFHAFCHFLIDGIKYYSHQYNQEILTLIFQAITALLKQHSCKGYMLAAMNIDKPELTFLSKNIGNELRYSISKLLVLIFEDQLFYNSFIKLEQEAYIETGKIFAHRYRPDYALAIQRNPFVTQVYSSYWISQLLSTISNQYDPQILELILSKFLIFPHNNQCVNVVRVNRYLGTTYVDIPYLLEQMIKILNNSKFQSQLLSYFQVANCFSKGHYILKNKKLLLDIDQNFRNIFYSVKLLRTILKIMTIYKYFSKQYSNHWAMHCISSLQSLERIQKWLYTDEDNSNISAILQIASLIHQVSPLTNVSRKLNIVWQIIGNNYNQVQTKIQNSMPTISILNGFSLLNFLNFSHNKYLQQMQSIEILALQCLELAINQIPAKKVSIQEKLFIRLPNHGLTIKHVEQNQGIKLQFQDRLIELMNSQYIENSEMAFNFILKCHQSSTNKTFAQRVMKKYLSKCPNHIKLPLRVNSIFTQILELSDQIQVTNQMLLYNIQTTTTKKFQLLHQLADDYSLIEFPLATYHQLERVIQERQLMNTADMYQWLKSMISVVIKQILANKTNSSSLASSLIKFIVRNKLICLSGDNSINCKFMQNYPRYFHADPLQRFISAYSQQNKKQQMQSLQKLQITNVRQWCFYISYQLATTINQFLLLLLSIDGAFYSNLPMDFKTRSHKQLFCHMHMGDVKATAFELFGSYNADAVENVRSIGEIALNKIKNSMENQVIGMRITIACLDWLGSKQIPIAFKPLSSLLNTLTINQSIWLKQSINSQEQARLILSYLLYQKDAKIEFKQTLKQAIYNSIIYQQQSQKIRNLLISCLNLLIPNSDDTLIIEILIQMWTRQTNNQNFYVITKILIEIAAEHPLQIVKYKALSRCEKLKQLKNTNISVRYHQQRIGKPQVTRSPQNIIWIWCMKLVSILAASNMRSTILTEELSVFMLQHRSNIIATLQQANNTLMLGNGLKYQNQKNNGKSMLLKTQQRIFNLSYAYLQELDQTLQLIAAMVSLEGWVNTQRDYFEQLTYLLTHHAASIFFGNQYSKRKYVSSSTLEEIISTIYYRNNLNRQHSQSIQYDMLYEILAFSKAQSIQSKSFSSINTSKINAFSWIMEIKYFMCMKSFLIACMISLKESLYIQKYFNQSITPLKPTSNSQSYTAVNLSINNQKKSIESYRYGIMYWDRMNKLILDMGKSVSILLKKFKSVRQLNSIVNLLYQSYSSPDFFTENGYLPSIISIPNNQFELLSSMRLVSVLVSEFGQMHLIHSMKYKHKNSSLMKSHLQGFQRKLIQNNKQLQEELEILFNQKQYEDEEQFEGKQLAMARNRIDSLIIR